MAEDVARHRPGFAAIVRAPDAIVLALLALSTAVTVALSLRAFTPWLVVPLFLLLLVGLGRFVPAAVGTKRMDVVGPLVSMLVAVAWIVLNLPYVAELLVVGRDPGIYTVMGIWLGDHTSLDIPARATLALADSVPGTSAELTPYASDASGVMHGQGGVTLPGLLGIGAWLGGIDGVLRTNVVVGGIGLVSMYALARRFVHPVLALAAQIALGLSMPYLYLMRAPYSESIAMIAPIAALIWLLAAIRERRTSLAAVGGLLLGVTTMARVDGPLALVGSAALVAVTALVTTPETLRRLRRPMLVYLGAGLVSSLGGLLSMYVSQRRYLSDLHDQVLFLWLATGAACIVALACLGFRSTRRGAAGPGDAVLRVTGVALGAFVPAVFVLWWSRPAWWQGHFTPIESPYARAIEGMQGRTGLPVDGTRSYDELTLHWVGWYFGWVTVALAAVGLGLLVWRGVARPDVTALVVAVPTAVAAMLYFNKVSITPDQMWAYRRILPIITPGLLVGAVFAVEWGVRALPPRVPRGALRGVMVTVLAIVVAGAPLLSWNQLVRVPEAEGNRRVVESMCGQLHAKTVLVASGHSPATIGYTIKGVCGVDVVVGPASSAAYLGRLGARVDDLQVVAFAKEDLPRDARSAEPNVVGTRRQWQNTLVAPPDGYLESPWTVWIGRVDGGRFVQDR